MNQTLLSHQAVDKTSGHQTHKVQYDNREKVAVSMGNCPQAKEVVWMQPCLYVLHIGHNPKFALLHLKCMDNILHIFYRGELQLKSVG